jgi:hypothetical protein
MAALFEEAQASVLYAVWNEAYDPNTSSPYSMQDVGRFVIPSEYSALIARKAVKALIERELLEQTDRYGDTFEISAQGIQHVERELEGATSLISRAARAWEEHRDPSVLQHQLDAPLLDVDWEPLKIERDSAPYRDALEAVSQAVETIRGDNGYAHSQPEQRNSVLSTVETGLQLLKERILTRTQFTELLFRPLTFLAKKFAETAMGEVAKIAVSALRNLIG